MVLDCSINDFGKPSLDSSCDLRSLLALTHGHFDIFPPVTDGCDRNEELGSSVYQSEVLGRGQTDCNAWSKGFKKTALISRFNHAGNGELSLDGLYVRGEPWPAPDSFVS